MYRKSTVQSTIIGERAEKPRLGVFAWNVWDGKRKKSKNALIMIALYIAGGCEAEMKEHPIIFTTEMVRAILDGRKTMTRRVIKPQPNKRIQFFEDCTEGIWAGLTNGEKEYKQQLADGMPKNVAVKYDRYEYWRECCPYGQVGDRLWVKETWIQKGRWIPRFDGCENDWEKCSWIDTTEIHYTATPHQLPKLPEGWSWRKRPSIHMPKWAARIWLEITGIKVERLKEITHGNALSEGCFDFVFESDSKYYNDHEFTIHKNGDIFRQTALIAFRELWNSLNAKRGYSWESNPWVWVIEFKRLK